MANILVTILSESWSVLGQMAPYLLFGFLVAGIISVCISPAMVERHLGGRGFGPVVKAALLGVPLPLCSCGVIPVSASFRRHGASRAATTSFLLSTPQTGVDSIAITYALLGTLFAVARPIIALATGLLGGLLVMLFGQPNHEQEKTANAPECKEACCAEKDRKNVVRRALEYGFIALPRDIGLALLVGVVIAGGIGTFVSPNQWHSYLGGGILSIVTMMAIGIPLYVCASASVPIAAGFIYAGASPGAALAFLIAGPATNGATIATIWKVLGRRTTALYLLTIAISAVVGGLALDWLGPSIHMTIPMSPGHSHDEMAGSWLSECSAVVLLAVIAFSYAAGWAEDRATRNGMTEAGQQPGERLELAITGMTCAHCVASVRNALAACHGVTSAQVDLATARAVVVGSQFDAQQLLAAVKSSGYDANILA